MRFRPCIDIHNGKVKQIVGGSLRDLGDTAVENFVAEQDAGYYARLYQNLNLPGGHVILLNSRSSEYYEETKRQAKLALGAYPGGLMVGGGITADNAEEFLDAGASHVIVTSYVFRDGRISYENLEKLESRVGREHLTLDLSCRARDGRYFVVTDRWQKFTEEELTLELMLKLKDRCDEFLIHAVDVEGKACGIEVPVVELMASLSAVPVTYAGGVGSFEHLRTLRQAGKDKVDVTIGSALDLFGGTMKFREVLQYLYGSENAQSFLK